MYEDVKICKENHFTEKPPSLLLKSFECQVEYVYIFIWYIKKLNIQCETPEFARVLKRIRKIFAGRFGGIRGEDRRRRAAQPHSLATTGTPHAPSHESMSHRGFGSQI